MERLNLKECEKCKDWNGCISNCLNVCGKPLDALKEFNKLKDLEKQGRLLKLPCTVGDEIWDNDFGMSCSYTVTGFSIGKIDDEEENDIEGFRMYYRNRNGSICGSCLVSEIGKTVFLTKEEAEQTLGKNETDKLMIEYDKYFVPKELCTIDRLGGADDCMSCEEYCQTNGNNCDNCGIQNCFEKLAEYENTGLTPEQIKELQGKAG